VTEVSDKHTQILCDSFSRLYNHLYFLIFIGTCSAEKGIAPLFHFAITAPARCVC